MADWMKTHWREVPASCMARGAERTAAMHGQVDGKPSFSADPVARSKVPAVSTTPSHVQPMSEKLVYLLQRLSRKTWWRCAMFSLFAVAAVVLASVLGPHIPPTVALKLGSDAIGSLLGILASSMLTVAIFSASTMVSSFSAVANSATPRASQLLIEDSTIQNTLAAFIGAFLYSIIALVGLHAHVYGDGGRLVLFAFTLAVLLIVVVVLLRWIDYLSVLGRLGETIRRVEAATVKAMDQRIDRPFLGGRRQRADERGADDVRAATTGFVQHVSMDLLQAKARALDTRLHLHALPGTFVDPSRVLVSSEAALDDADRQAIRQAILIGPGRSFDHDPRFGLVVMGEIAARALSASINDPGTVLDVMATAVRTLSHWADRQAQQGIADAKDMPFDRVTAPAVREEGMLEDVFMPIARYGAPAVDVGVVLQRALRSVQRLYPRFVDEAGHIAAYALERAAHEGLCASDLDALRAAHAGQGEGLTRPARPTP